MINYTYQNCKTLIENNRYEFNDMMNKLDLFLMLDRITNEQYIELTGMMFKPEEPIPEPEQDTLPEVTEAA